MNALAAYLCCILFRTRLKSKSINAVDIALLQSNHRWMYDLYAGAGRAIAVPLQSSLDSPAGPTFAHPRRCTAARRRRCRRPFDRSLCVATTTVQQLDRRVWSFSSWAATEHACGQMHRSGLATVDGWIKKVIIRERFKVAIPINSEFESDGTSDN
jgi:hypothetical protein